MTDLQRVDADAALERLRAGNLRFARDDTPTIAASGGSTERRQLVSGQNPLAIVLSCSDARVPAELVFDQGIGELFVVRVAGNVVTPTQAGSVEFAVVTCGTPLVVVMGHTGCGAVAATIDTVMFGTPPPSQSVGAIVAEVRPTVERLVADGEQPGSPAFADKAVEHNVHASVARLMASSDILRERSRRGAIRVVGAVYDLETGLVSFLETGDGEVTA